MPVRIAASIHSKHEISIDTFIKVHVKKPDGNVSDFYLYDDGEHGDIAECDGVYGNYFEETDRIGRYTFNLEARGRLGDVSFVRYSELSLTVLLQVQLRIRSLQNLQYSR
jgi:hypothetical protein